MRYIALVFPAYLLLVACTGEEEVGLLKDPPPTVEVASASPRATPPARATPLKAGDGPANYPSPLGTPPTLSPEDQAHLEELQRISGEEPYTGDIGEFAAGEGSRSPFCEGWPHTEFGATEDRELIEASDLWLPALSDTPHNAFLCADGKTLSCISYWDLMEGDGTRTQSGAIRCHFTGRPSANIGAPLERLVLLDVAGKPAIGELPASSITSTAERVTVIERMPEEGRPGILLTIEVLSAFPKDDLPEAIELAETILSDLPAAH